MSRFFSVLNSGSGGSSQIDDENPSTDSTYSSFQINKLLNDLASMLIGYAFLEYPSDIRASPQKTFETPNSSKGVMWVLREGVKMTKDVDYIITDDTHIEFVEDVSEIYTVSIFVIGSDAVTSSGTGGIIPSNPLVPIIFVQSTPTTSWSINHQGGFKYPRLIVVDDLDNQITDCVSIQYVDDNNCIISSEIPFRGKCIIYP